MNIEIQYTIIQYRISHKGRAKNVMRAKRVTAAPLPDGRIQLWGIFDDELFSCWKTTTNPDSAWTDWQHFPQPSHIITYINAAPLSDGRIQLSGYF